MILSDIVLQSVYAAYSGEGMTASYVLFQFIVPFLGILLVFYGFVKKES